MTRAIVCAALVVVATEAWGQGAPAFEVASVKPSEMPTMGKFVFLSHNDEPGRVTYKMMSLRDLIRTAYEVKDYQISGPDWLATARFDVEAKFSPDIPKDQVPQMLQALLAERFHLTVHKEKRDLPAYALIVAKNGPKLKESEEPPAPVTDPAGGPNGVPPAGGANVAFSTAAGAGGGAVKFSLKDGKIDGEKISKMMGGKGMIWFPGRVIANRTAMPALADMLSRQTDRPVVDETGLTGKYDFKLEFAPEQGSGGPGRLAFGGDAPPPSGSAGGSGEMKMPETPSGPPLAAALQQQLGLKLDPRKLPVDIVVVDRAEKIPTEN